MSATIMNKRNAIVCDCSECGTIVEITPFNGFDPDDNDDIDAEWTCCDCGKIVCESCHGDFQDVCYGDPEDSGGGDFGKICSDCFAKMERRISKSAPEGT